MFNITKHSGALYETAVSNMGRLRGAGRASLSTFDHCGLNSSVRRKKYSICLLYVIQLVHSIFARLHTPCILCIVHLALYGPLASNALCRECG
jgi:hypothetical protein